MIIELFLFFVLKNKKKNHKTFFNCFLKLFLKKLYKLAELLKIKY